MTIIETFARGSAPKTWPAGASIRSAAREAFSPIEHLEMLLHPWVAFAVMPLFALPNASVSIVPAEFHRGLAFAVFAGFVLGKPTGIVMFSAIAVKMGLGKRPAELLAVSWRRAPCSRASASPWPCLSPRWRSAGGCSPRRSSESWQHWLFSASGGLLTLLTSPRLLRAAGS